MRDVLQTTEMMSIITGDGSKPPKYRLSCRLITPGGVLIPLKVTSLNIDRDYTDGTFTESTGLVVAVQPGQYETIVYPYRDQLSVEITKTPLASESQAKSGVVLTPTVRAYRGMVTQQSSPMEEGANQSNLNAEVMDLKEIRAVGIQLIDPLVEDIKLITTGGVFQNISPVELIRLLYDTLCKGIERDEADKVKGVTLATNTASTMPLEQILIKQPTRLVDIPYYLQEESVGVYTTGIGRYYQDHYWFIYPLYDLKAFNTAPVKLTILNLPNNMMRNLERTYRFVEGHLYVISTMDTIAEDPALARLVNDGSGIRYVNARSLRNGYGVVEDNKIHQSRDNNIMEYIIGKQDSGIHYAPMSDKRITFNDAHERSKMAHREGAYMQLGWESSDPSLVYPGMAARVITPIDGVDRVRYATVIASQTSVTNDSISPKDTTHTWRTAITLFIERGTGSELK